MTWEVLDGDVRERLADLADESVQTVVTSPPYYGLRDYGVDGQIGLEPTLGEYLATMVDVFAGVRRTLRSDGTLWLNIGDSYAAKPRGEDGSWDAKRIANPGRSQKQQAMKRSRRSASTAGAKYKDLMMVPALLALALRDDGWYLRAEVIWHKPTPMPESVRDRPTKSHEQIYLFAKSPRYFYDAEAIREPDKGADHPRSVLHQPEPSGGLAPPNRGIRKAEGRNGRGANKRSVWTIHSGAYPEAHFATFPPALVEPCILAGTSPQACIACGSPWRRILKRAPVGDYGSRTLGLDEREVGHTRNSLPGGGQPYAPPETIGWEPTCDHSNGEAGCMVLDPFAGAGTTGLVAARLDRDFIGIELNPDYAEMARTRIRDDAPLINSPAEVAA